MGGRFASDVAAPLRSFENAFVLFHGRGHGPNAALAIEHLPAEQGRVVRLHQRRQLAAQPALAVQQPDRLAELAVRNVHGKPLRQERPKLLQLLNPIRQCVRVVAAVRQFEDVHRPRLGHQLVHLLLAVAGGLAHHQVGHFEKRVAAKQVVAVGRLDQRAEIGGQVLLGGGNGFRRAAAEADRHAAGRHDQLARRVLAEDAHHRPAGLLRRRRILVTMLDHAIEPGARAFRRHGPVVALAAALGHIGFSSRRCKTIGDRSRLPQNTQTIP